MTRTSALAVSALFLGALTFANPSLAGYHDNTGGAAAPASIGGVLREFSNGTQQLCGRVPDPAYTVDCLADYFEWLADNLPQTQDFREARAIVDDAARQLNRVARTNAARGKSPAVLRQNNSANAARTRRPVIPVAPERQAAAQTAAVAIVRETQTRLLRAAEQSERRRVAFTEIAQAIGSSSRILLRSG